MRLLYAGEKKGKRLVRESGSQPPEPNCRHTRRSQAATKAFVGIISELVGGVILVGAVAHVTISLLQAWVGSRVEDSS